MSSGAEVDDPTGDAPSPDAGFADFSQVWEQTGAEAAAAPPPAPPLPDGFAEYLSAHQFSGFAEIDSFFKTNTGASFIGWFNEKLADRDPFVNKRVSAAQAETHFQSYWDSYARGVGVSLLEFLAYMSIFINERNGDLVSKSELFGSKGHPGVAYLFDSFAITTSSGLTFHKASYNQAPLNKLAGRLFSDAEFNAAHGALPLADRLKGSTDAVWLGTTFPQTAFPTSGDPKVEGYLSQADFFKFRGRGLIQTTWRTNYEALVEFVQGYAGPNARLATYRDKWKGRSTDSVCTTSTTEEWDEVFEATDNEVVCAAVRLHAKAFRYLPLATATPTLNGTGVGSLANMGRRIGGGASYGALFKSRVLKLGVTLGL